MSKNQNKEVNQMSLINEISKAYRNALSKASEKAGVPLGYRALLDSLADHDGTTQFELTGLANLKAPTVSLALQKMEAEGYVERKTDSYDLRVTHVFLTDKGRTIVDNNRTVAENFTKQLVSGMNTEDKATLLGLLQKAKKNVLPDKN